MKLTRHRRVDTGEYVTEAYALRNPNTTVAETYEPADKKDFHEKSILQTFEGIETANDEDLAEWELQGYAIVRRKVQERREALRVLVEVK